MMDKTPLSSETRLLLRLMNLKAMNSVETEGTTLSYSLIAHLFPERFFLNFAVQLANNHQTSIARG
jgi:hypothetical protein